MLFLGLWYRDEAEIQLKLPGNNDFLQDQDMERNGLRKRSRRYRRFCVKGWNREDNMQDDLYRFEADLLITSKMASLIRRWKSVLARRFKQREIYIKISERVRWV